MPPANISASSPTNAQHDRYYHRGEHAHHDKTTQHALDAAAHTLRQHRFVPGDPANVNTRQTAPALPHRAPALQPVSRSPVTRWSAWVRSAWVVAAYHYGGDVVDVDGETVVASRCRLRLRVDMTVQHVRYRRSGLP